MKAAQIEFERLQNAYPAVSYEVALLPKTNVAERADYVLQFLSDH